MLLLRRLALAGILGAVGYAHAADSPPASPLPIAPGDVTWPGALVLAGWWLGRWRPTLRVEIHQVAPPAPRGDVARAGEGTGWPS